MTFILAVNTDESIFLLADRRLSSPTSYRDDARKIMVLETKDGVAILGYAGLGMTVKGTEPSDWMSGVLRGRSGRTLEQCLGVLAEAVNSQIPPHLSGLPTGIARVHHIIVPAFLGNEVRIYSIDIAVSKDGEQIISRFTHYKTSKGHTPTITMCGTGGMFLNHQKERKRWLQTIIKAYENGRVSEQALADHLAKLNTFVAASIRDNSVGPHCIVAWQHRKQGIHKGGGGHQFYTNGVRATETLALPTIANGIDVTAVVNITTRQFMESLRAWKPGDNFQFKKINEAELNAELALLPDKPDENLR